MTSNEKINYIELPASDLLRTKRFFTEVFDWSFQDYGPDYTAFSGQGIDGGFYKADLQSSSSNGAALIIFYSKDLEATQVRIERAGGIILKATYNFPGGRRFHFSEPSGNEFAVWSDRDPI